MLKVILAAFLVASATPAPSQDAAAPAPSAEEQFRQRELAWVDALADEDRPALEAILAPELSIEGSPNPASQRRHPGARPGLAAELIQS